MIIRSGYIVYTYIYALLAHWAYIGGIFIVLVGTDDGLSSRILMEVPVCLGLGLGLPGGVTPRSTAHTLISK